jgi:hypothetical protein
MRLFLSIFAAGMFLTVVTDCRAETGNSFLQRCSIIDKFYAGNAEKGTYDEIVNFSWCNGWVEGFVDGTQAEATAAGRCQLDTEKVEVGQVVRIILKYVRDHPETAHKDMRTLAQSALTKALPCTPTS